jgi:hypothetical protein
MLTLTFRQLHLDPVRARRLKWVGDSWDAPMNDPAARVETPVGIEPSHRGERATAGDTIIRFAPVLQLGWALFLWPLHRAQ